MKEGFFIFLIIYSILSTLYLLFLSLELHKRNKEVHGFIEDINDIKKKSKELADSFEQEMRNAFLIVQKTRVQAETTLDVMSQRLSGYIRKTPEETKQIYAQLIDSIVEAIVSDDDSHIEKLISESSEDNTEEIDA